MAPSCILPRAGPQPLTRPNEPWPMRASRFTCSSSNGMCNILMTSALTPLFLDDGPGGVISSQLVSDKPEKARTASKLSLVVPWPSLLTMEASRASAAMESGGALHTERHRWHCLPCSQQCSRQARVAKCLWAHCLWASSRSLVGAALHTQARAHASAWCGGHCMRALGEPGKPPALSSITTSLQHDQRPQWLTSSINSTDTDLCGPTNCSASPCSLP
jgi:hypothetical protein